MLRLWQRGKKMQQHKAGKMLRLQQRDKKMQRQNSKKKMIEIGEKQQMLQIGKWKKISEPGSSSNNSWKLLPNALKILLWVMEVKDLRVETKVMVVIKEMPM